MKYYSAYRFSVAKRKAVLFVLFFLCWHASFSQHKIGQLDSFIVYHGSKFELSGPRMPHADTITVIDPENGKQILKISRRITIPMLMNGERIYSEDSVENVFGMHMNNAGFNSDNIREYLVMNLKDEFKQFPDGDFFFDIFNIVIDTNGKIAYFEFEGIKDHNMWREPGNKRIQIDDKLQKRVIQKVCALMDSAIPHKPCMVHYDPVPCVITNYDAFYTSAITIKNGKVIKL